ncbi:MAG TPA: phosphatidate cytidylyltransferase [Saprospiraceae bacterium]|nr:phosphatidate cytidylyltransferase [Saprospiraceae bacterium]
MATSELRQRVITGLAIGLVIIGATLTGIIPTFILIVLIIMGSILEFYRLQLTRMRNANILIPSLISITPLLAMMMISVQQSAMISAQLRGWWLTLLAISLMLYFITQLKSELQDIENRLMIFSTSILLFTIPGCAAIYLSTISPKLLLGTFILIWSSDVFAYFGGKAFGRYKLAPLISPKKTWEGLISGLLSTGLAAWGLSVLFPENILKDWLITGLLVVIFGTLGDLLQSAIKRAVGVKDSGSLLPGHGGMWDRFDSFLGCIPWVGAYYLLM